MKKSHQWKENLLSALEVPGDLAGKETIITITGKNQAVLENYRSLFRYTRDEIIILTFNGKLAIRGKNLEIPWYTSDEIKIHGRFSMIILEKQEEKG